MFELIYMFDRCQLQFSAMAVLMYIFIYLFFNRQFAVILFIIFIIELASGIAAYVLKDKIHKQLIEEAHTVIKEYPKDKKAVDDLQKKLQCCGAENYTDWFGNTKWANSTAPNTSVPDSCCKLVPATKVPPHGCGQKISKDTIYMEGCVKKVENIIKKNVLIIGGVAIGIGFAQIIGILFACLLMKGIKHDYEVM
uniref:Tetraspanin n=1 Tax=Eptatretus burgeri TaxID=7764 RepID=A0A8C4N9T4_EPTBU